MRKKQLAAVTLAVTLAWGTLACHKTEEVDSEPIQQEVKEPEQEQPTASVLTPEEVEEQNTQAKSTEFDLPEEATSEDLFGEDDEDLDDFDLDDLDLEDEESEESISFDPTWEYAEYSAINTGEAKLYRNQGDNANGITVCVNAGHGTSGGSSVKTQCHPDGTPKVTSGTTSAGATEAIAISEGMTFNDGTPESSVTLAMAMKLKEELLSRGYNVLMIRESEDVQLDNIARTVIANNNADCHIALHWDSTESDKGAFFLSVPEVDSYRSMEPVASHYEDHDRLGSCLVEGLGNNGVHIFSSGSMEMDLTQTSYSTVPSVDIELGDQASDHSDSTLEQMAYGLADGVDAFFQNTDTTEASTEDTEAEDDTQESSDEDKDYVDSEDSEDQDYEDGDSEDQRQDDSGDGISDDSDQSDGDYEGEFSQDYTDDDSISDSE